MPKRVPRLVAETPEEQARYTRAETHRLSKRGT
jgi:hypothetical protein